MMCLGLSKSLLWVKKKPPASGTCPDLQGRDDGINSSSIEPQPCLCRFAGANSSETLWGNAVQEGGRHARTHTQERAADVCKRRSKRGSNAAQTLCRRDTMRNLERSRKLDQDPVLGRLAVPWDVLQRGSHLHCSARVHNVQHDARVMQHCTAQHNAHVLG